LLKIMSVILRTPSVLFFAAVVALLASECLAWRRQPEYRDYYNILQIGRGATEDEIKKSFKKLARKYHPDAQKGLSTDAEREAARAKFMEISDAYEVLIDPKKRAALDDSNGQRGPVSAGDDRNFLRHNLFQNDFDGDNLQSEELERTIQGKDVQSTLVFFWSSEIPDCIDPGLDYKRMASRLKGSSMRVGAFNCDQWFQGCRRMLGLTTLPAMLLFPAKSPNIEYYSGKYEAHNMAEFAAKHLRAHRLHNRNSSVDAILHVTPNVLLNPQLRKPHGWITPYFSEVLGKRSIGHTVSAEFVAFVFGPCYDCTTELNFAIEGLAPVMPSLVTRRVECQSYSARKRCEAVVGKVSDRAWVIAHVQRTCYFATKKPFVFSDEHCAPDVVEIYDGKYKASEFASFILSKHKSHALQLKSLRKAKTSNDSFAVLFVDSQQDKNYLSNWRHEWEVLSRALNSYKPIVGAKKWRVRAVIVDCSTAEPGACDDVKLQQKPVAALYSFGVKAKSTAPHLYHKIGSAFGFMKLIERDMEPLHLYVITSKKMFEEKISATVAKGRRWIVLFNAGQWCPPCNQIRDVWRQVARLVQNHPTAPAKLSVAVVDCDHYPDVCQQQSIDNFPTIYFHAKDRSRMPYNGNRDAQSITNWAVESIDNRLLRLGFQELSYNVQRGETMLISFTAGEWCPPCTQLKPAFKQVANTLSNRMVVEVNCDQDQFTCHNFGIQGYPTVVLYHRQRRTEYPQGMKTADNIVQWVKQNTH
jgi:thioredoxin-like negative regulator of GroEL